MPFKDVREYISKLEEAGEAIKINEEVDWNLEAGAILRRSAEKALPAPFFQKLKDYPKGYRLVGNLAATFRRMAISMDMHPDTHPKDLIEEIVQRKKKLIKPVIVKDGPCKENIHIGKDADLFEFPVPMLHDGDGGRYMGTWHVVISKDIDSDWVNWGMYRNVAHDSRSLGLLQASLGKHLWAMFSQGYSLQKKAMDVAIVMGVEPISTMCAASPIPPGVSEVDVVGGIRGEPMELVKCQTNDLYVPATSEIVVEGEIRPGDVQDEGPFGEFTGYMTKRVIPRPVIRVNAITHRNNPILTTCCPGIPVDDNAIFSLTKAAEILDALRAQRKPVTNVFVPLETTHMLAIVSVSKARYPGVAEDIAHIIWSQGSLAHETPYIIVVEDDVDPFNLAEVMHTVITKCHPVRGIHAIDRGTVISIAPWLNKQEQLSKLGAKAYFDCTYPMDWEPADTPIRISFAQSYPKDVQQKALDLWNKYGYK